MASFDALWADLFPAEQAHIAQFLIARVTVGPSGLRVDMRDDGIARVVTEITEPKPERTVA